MMRQGSPPLCPSLHRPIARPPPRSTSSENRSCLHSHFHSRSQASKSNALDSRRRFSHTPPRHSETTDSLGGIKANADLLCYLRFKEKARPLEGTERNQFLTSQ